MNQNANVIDNTRVSGTAQVYGNARVSGTAQVYGNARVYGDALVSGTAQVHGDAWVHGNAWVHGTAVVRDGGDVFDLGHVITVTGLLQETVTMYRTRGGGHAVAAGCQTFQLTDDIPAIAREHNWNLPTGWTAWRDALLTVAEGWKAAG